MDPPGAMSDHSLITCNLPYRRTTPPTTRRRVRSWRTVDRDALRQAIMDCPLGCDEIPASATADELFAMYDRTLRDIADQFAPERTVQSKLSPWFDSECRAIRRNCRRLERLYRRTRSAADGQAWRPLKATGRRSSRTREIDAGLTASLTRPARQ